MVWFYSLYPQYVIMSKHLDFGNPKRSFDCIELMIREAIKRKTAEAELGQTQLQTGIKLYFDYDLLHKIDYQELSATPMV